MAIKEFGSGNDCGWSKTNDFVDLNGLHTIEFQGRADKIKEFYATLTSGEYSWDRCETTLDQQTGVATIHIYDENSSEEVAHPTTEETRLPTVVIQGAMNALQLHQSPYFNSSKAGESLTTEAIVATDYCLKNFGQVTSGDLNGENAVGIEYAQWRSFGIDTFLAPTYVMTITFYLNSKSNIAKRIFEAGKVFKFASLLKDIPKKIQPIDINVPAWLAQAPSINSSTEGFVLSQQFIGAQKFPKFYPSEDDGLLYSAPALPDGKWKNTKYPTASSGTPSSVSEE